QLLVLRRRNGLQDLAAPQASSLRRQDEKRVDALDPIHDAQPRSVEILPSPRLEARLHVTDAHGDARVDFEKPGRGPCLAGADGGEQRVESRLRISGDDRLDLDVQTLD